MMGDARVHISGIITDETGQPIEGAKVSFGDLAEETTPKDGSFFFGGHLPPFGKLPIKATKPGFKSYEGRKSFNYYDVKVTLAAETNLVPSKAVWTVLKNEDRGNYYRSQEP